MIGENSELFKVCFGKQKFLAFGKFGSIAVTCNLESHKSDTKFGRPKPKETLSMA
jgi:hypothetical protein